MILSLRITNKTEAAEAINMLRAYTDTQEEGTTPIPVEEPKVEEPKTKAKKKAPVKAKEEPKAEEPKAEEPKTDQPTLAELTNLAKETAKTAGKEAVKAAITLYGVNLRAVPEEVYGTLFKALKAL